MFSAGIHKSLSQPWVEKYRPSTLKEISSQSLTVKTLEQFVAQKTFPHLIFTGPAGTGKTSAAVALIQDLVGEGNLTQDMVLEKNASDEMLKDNLIEIKHFVNYQGMGSASNFKFVLLDESDHLSNVVQSAFRRIIELAPPNVKFIFMCNYVEKIIDPILSRCAIFRFYPLPKKDFSARMRYIAEKEKVPITEEILDAIYFITQADMRKAVNLFQMYVSLLEDTKGKFSEQNLDLDTLYEISGFIPPKLIDSITTDIFKMNFLELVAKLHEIKSFSSRGFFRQLLKEILESDTKYPYREQLMNALAEYDYRLTLEADPQIQIDGLVAELISILEGSR